MIISNIEALKKADNLKWDFQAGYQKALQIFNYSGDMNEEYKKIVKEVVDQMKEIVESAEFLKKEAEKLID